MFQIEGARMVTTSKLIRHSVGFGPGPAPVYFEKSEPPHPTDLPLVFMLHGGAHTGSCFQRTVDGGPGWAYLFAERGYTSVVVDWLGVWVRIHH